MLPLASSVELATGTFLLLTLVGGLAFGVVLERAGFGSGCKLVTDTRDSQSQGNVAVDVATQLVQVKKVPAIIELGRYRRIDRTHDSRLFGAAGWLWTAGMLALPGLALAASASSSTLRGASSSSRSRMPASTAAGWRR